MNKEMTYLPLDKKYAALAYSMVKSAWQDERKTVSYLPEENSMDESLISLLSDLFENGSGVMGFMGSELVGFLGGKPVPELFGPVKGVYIPLYGHGIKKEYSQELYQDLYTAAALKWVHSGFTSHAVTVFAHDEALLSLWNNMGFGLRCEDAIRETSLIYGENPEITVKKANKTDLLKLTGLHERHHQYYKESPMFIYHADEDPKLDLLNWFSQENRHLWYAESDGKPVGYMRIEPEGESFISHHQSIMNITAAFVLPEVRHTGAGAMLIKAIQEYLMKKHYPLCGVDYETMNLLGSRFWSKYFTPYSYSLTRRIDERMING